MRDATIYDVAARAGVSISTVSLSLNRPSRVGPPTRQRVLAAIDALGYMPKAAAVIHARQSVARIGVVAPFTSYRSYGQRLNGVLASLDDRETVVFDEESAASAANPLQSTLPLRRRLDGLIVMGLPLGDEASARVRRHGLPTVLIDSVRADFTSVSSDDELGGYLVGRHLIGRGHRRIAFVSESQRSRAYVSQGQQRMAGLKRAAAESELTAVSWVKVTNDIAGGRAAVSRVLKAKATAVFAHHDLLAAGVLLELRDRGLRAPDDMAVVGFDDGDVAEATGLTTVRQPLEESGRVAADALLARIADDTTPVQHITLPLELIVREST
jgi:DNA-binding LacI/PurR family transcriptional regulator